MWRYDLARTLIGGLLIGLAMALFLLGQFEVIDPKATLGLFLVWAVVMFFGGFLTGIERPQETHEYCGVKRPAGVHRRVA